MKIASTALPGVLLVEPTVFSDHRGHFLESWRQEAYAARGIGPFVQDNFSFSRRGVLRGLHYQLRRPQGKLVHVARGKVLDVAADIRVGSPTFGASVAVVLSDENHSQLWIPPGFAHGFLVLSDGASFIYKVTAYHSPGDERMVRWNDPTLKIDWGAVEPILSPRDAAAPLLADAELPKLEP